MPSVPQSDPARPLLLRALARPRAIALGCIALLAAGGWGYLGLVLAAQQSSSVWRALCQPIYGMTGGMSLAGTSLTFAMWCAMVLAMMLPTAAPMVMTYADLTEAAAAKGEPAASPVVLTSGYITVWLGAAAVLTAAQGLLLRLDLLDVRVGFANPFIAGTLFLAAGAYQFSSAKRACLTHCQHPFRFFFANWTSRSPAVFRMGVRQGLYCLGCCWAMMLLMFAVGMMNVVWMAILGIVMAIEKLGASMRFSRAAGVVFVAIGAFIIVETWITGWPRPG
jgi:predicted metal-binding membrane protein